MPSLSEQLDSLLCDLAWSLWTELGVLGNARNHSCCSIDLEILILLTAVLAEKDPRLKNEALDWCAKNHRLISTSRLRFLGKSLLPLIAKPLSQFGSALNDLGPAHFPIFEHTAPIKSSLSGKSQPCQMDRPALLSLKLRELFGVGARADLILWSLTRPYMSEFSASDATDCGYSKRAIAATLESLVATSLFSARRVGNQKRYRLEKRSVLLELLGPLPSRFPAWTAWLEIVLPLRDCLQRIEGKVESVRVVEIRNQLNRLQDKLAKLGLTPPPLHTNFQAYWQAFSKWLQMLQQGA